MSTEQLILQRLKSLSEVQKQRLLRLMDEIEMPASDTVSGLPLVANPRPVTLGVAEGQYTTTDDFDAPIDEIFGF